MNRIFSSLVSKTRVYQPNERFTKRNIFKAPSTSGKLAKSSLGLIWSSKMIHDGNTFQALASEWILLHLPLKKISVTNCTNMLLYNCFAHWLTDEILGTPERSTIMPVGPELTWGSLGIMWVTIHTCIHTLTYLSLHIITWSRRSNLPTGLHFFSWEETTSTYLT